MFQFFNKKRDSSRNDSQKRDNSNKNSRQNTEDNIGKQNSLNENKTHSGNNKKNSSKGLNQELTSSSNKNTQVDQRQPVHSQNLQSQTRESSYNPPVMKNNNLAQMQIQNDGGKKQNHQSSSSGQNKKSSHKSKQNTQSVNRESVNMGGIITQVQKGEKAPKSYNQSQGQTNNQGSVPWQKYQMPTTANMEKQRIMSYLAQKDRELEQNKSKIVPLLKPIKDELKGRKTLILDVDETLVHSSFKPPPNPNIIIPIDIEGRICNIFILVRPHAVEFINEMSKYFELAIFTASLSKYADPLMNILDSNNHAPQRLFRQHCTLFNGQFVKDMTRIGRDPRDIIILDNSPSAYMFQPENGMPILSWYEDKSDTKLMDLVPCLKLLSQRTIDDVRPILLSCVDPDTKLFMHDKAVNMCQQQIEYNSTLYPTKTSVTNTMTQQTIIGGQGNQSGGNNQDKQKTLVNTFFSQNKTKVPIKPNSISQTVEDNQTDMPAQTTLDHGASSDQNTMQVLQSLGSDVAHPDHPIPNPSPKLKQKDSSKLQQQLREIHQDVEQEQKEKHYNKQKQGQIQIQDHRASGDSNMKRDNSGIQQETPKAIKQKQGKRSNSKQGNQEGEDNNVTTNALDESPIVNKMQNRYGNAQNSQPQNSRKSSSQNTNAITQSQTNNNSTNSKLISNIKAIHNHRGQTSSSQNSVPTQSNQYNSQPQANPLRIHQQNNLMKSQQNGLPPQHLGSANINQQSTPTGQLNSTTGSQGINQLMDFKKKQMNKTQPLNFSQITNSQNNSKNMGQQHRNSEQMYPGQTQSEFLQYCQAQAAQQSSNGTQSQQNHKRSISLKYQQQLQQQHNQQASKNVYDNTQINLAGTSNGLQNTFTTTQTHQSIKGSIPQTAHSKIRSNQQRSSLQQISGGSIHNPQQQFYNTQQQLYFSGHHNNPNSPQNYQSAQYQSSQQAHQKQHKRMSSAAQQKPPMQPTNNVYDAQMMATNNSSHRGGVNQGPQENQKLIKYQQHSQNQSARQNQKLTVRTSLDHEMRMSADNQYHHQNHHLVKSFNSKHQQNNWSTDPHTNLMASGALQNQKQGGSINNSIKNSSGYHAHRPHSNSNQKGQIQSNSIQQQQQNQQQIHLNTQNSVQSKKQSIQGSVGGHSNGQQFYPSAGQGNILTAKHMTNKSFQFENSHNTGKTQILTKNQISMARELQQQAAANQKQHHIKQSFKQISSQQNQQYNSTGGQQFSGSSQNGATKKRKNSYKEIVSQNLNQNSNQFATGGDTNGTPKGGNRPSTSSNLNGNLQAVDQNGKQRSSSRDNYKTPGNIFKLEKLNSKKGSIQNSDNADGTYMNTRQSLQQQQNEQNQLLLKQTQEQYKGLLMNGQQNGSSGSKIKMKTSSNSINRQSDAQQQQYLQSNNLMLQQQSSDSQQMNNSGRPANGNSSLQMKHRENSGKRAQQADNIAAQQNKSGYQQGIKGVKVLQQSQQNNNMMQINVSNQLPNKNHQQHQINDPSQNGPNNSQRQPNFMPQNTTSYPVQSNGGVAHMGKNSLAYQHQQIQQQFGGIELKEAQSVKNKRIANLMNDYELTQVFNKEVMKNIGSPKGPMFTRQQNK